MALPIKSDIFIARKCMDTKWRCINEVPLLTGETADVNAGNKDSVTRKLTKIDQVTYLTDGNTSCGVAGEISKRESSCDEEIGV